jgi:ribosomal protein S18 acetylase RimI-like enzyme
VQGWAFSSAADHPLSGLARLFTDSFAGYLVPMEMSADALAERVAAEDIHLASSLVLLSGGEPAGLGLMARRGRLSRVAAMGLVPQVRGQGAGRALLAELLLEARARGDRSVLLEVFESNAPARTLYEHAGFRRTARLIGYEAKHPQARPADLREIDATQFARHLGRADPGPLPWQLQACSLAAPPASARCFTLEDKAFVYLSAVSEARLSIRGVLTLPEHRRQGWATRLLAGLAASFPGRAMAVPQLIPEHLGAEFFAARGFTPIPLALLEMALPLEG